MKDNKSIKALKKQMAAAVAMVLVAAIALGSSTNAWFVSNNQVTATTTNISAQSNSAYLVIDTQTTSTTSTSAATAKERPATTKLYPAQVVGKLSDNTAKFESAYASAAGAATEKADTRFAIKHTGETDGSAAAAVAESYAIKNTFYVGTGTYDGSFTDLKVTAVSVSSKNTDLYTVAAGTETGYANEETTYAYLKGTTPASADDFITKAQYDAVATTASELVDAMRVLVVCGNNWVVYKNGATATDAIVTQYNNMGTMTAITGYKTDEVLAATVEKGTDAQVDVYVFYDGADTNVFSDNLADLKDCGVTITFEATPVTHGA